MAQPLTPENRVAPPPEDGRWIAKVQKGMASTIRAVIQLTEWLAYGLVIFIVIVLTLQILYRYVLSLPLSWSEEAARFALVWLTLLAGTVGVYRAEHFVFGWFIAALTPRWRSAVRRLVDGIVFITLLLICLQSWGYLSVVAHRTAAGTNLNMQIPYFSVFCGVALMALIYLWQLLDWVCSLRTGLILSIRDRAAPAPDKSGESRPQEPNP